MTKRFISNINPFVARHAASVAGAVAVALLLQPYIGFSNDYWLVLSSFMVCQTTRGTPLKQGMLVALLMVLGLSALAVLNNVTMLADKELLIVAVVSTVLVWYVRARRTLRAQYLYSLLVTLLIAQLFPLGSGWLVVKFHIADILIGAFIGLSCSMIILPVQTVKEFLLGVVPTLTILGDYSQKLSEYFSEEETSVVLTKQMQEVRESLQSPTSLYPNWVYEVGFNRGLRAGFRYFLIKVECLAELVFSMDYLLEKNIKKDVPVELYQHVAKVTHHNAILIQAICAHFEKEKVVKVDLDLTEDLDAFEQASKRFFSGTIALLDISEQHMRLALFVRNIKDMRTRLLQLASTIP